MYHATLLSVWGRLREFCQQAGGIGDAPEAHHLPLPAEDLAVALRSRIEGMTAPVTCPTLTHVTLSALLETLGILAGKRLGLEGLNAFTYPLAVPAIVAALHQARAE